MSITKSPRTAAAGSAAPYYLEWLEPRQLLTATPEVIKITSDNQGVTLIYFNAAMNTASFNGDTVVTRTAGKDGKLGTADDKTVKESLHYSAGSDALKIISTISANTPYIVYLTTHVKGMNGQSIHNSIAHAGSIAYEFTSTPVASTVDPTVDMVSNFGTVYVLLYRTKVAITVNNFLKYVNAGLYKGSIIHRMLPTADVESNGIAVIQGGGFTSTLTKQGIPSTIPTLPPIPLQTGIGNSQGTIAMARTSDPNSATDEFFFNTVANPSLNSTGTGTGYAVFGKVTSAASQSVLNTIDAIPTTSLNDPTDSGLFTDVPVQDGQFVGFEHVAVLNVVTSK